SGRLNSDGGNQSAKVVHLMGGRLILDRHVVAEVPVLSFRPESNATASAGERGERRVEARPGPDVDEDVEFRGTNRSNGRKRPMRRRLHVLIAGPHHQLGGTSIVLSRDQHYRRLRELSARVVENASQEDR